MRRLALGSATAIGLGRFAYGLVLPAMAGDLGWSFGTAATLAVANGVGYLAGALATPGAERRWGTRAVFRAGMVLCTVSLAGTAVTGDEYTVVLCARAVTGFAGALVFVSGAVLAPGRGFFAGAGLGVAAAGAVLPPLLAGAAGRWPLGWLYLAALAAACTAGSWRTVEGTPRVVAAEHGPVPVPVRHPATSGVLAPGPGGRSTGLVPVAVAYALFAAGYLAYLTFLSAYLDSRHAPAGLVAVVWTLLGLAVPAGLPLWGRMGLAGPLVVIALAAVGAYLWPVPGVVALSAAAYGAVFMAVPAAVTGIAKAAAGAGRATVVVARLTVVFALGQAAGPWLAGLVADRTEPAAALLWTAGLCTAAAVAAIAGAAVAGATMAGAAMAGAAMAGVAVAEAAVAEAAMAGVAVAEAAVAEAAMAEAAMAGVAVPKAAVPKAAVAGATMAGAVMAGVAVAEAAVAGSAATESAATRSAATGDQPCPRSDRAAPDERVTDA